MPLFDSSFENKSGSIHFFVFLFVLDFELHLPRLCWCPTNCTHQLSTRVHPRREVWRGRYSFGHSAGLPADAVFKTSVKPHPTYPPPAHPTPPTPTPTTFPILYRSLSNGTKFRQGIGGVGGGEWGGGREKRKLACAPCLATTTTIQHLASASPSASATSHVEPRLPANLDCC